MNVVHSIGDVLMPHPMLRSYNIVRLLQEVHHASMFEDMEVTFVWRKFRELAVLPHEHVEHGSGDGEPLLGQKERRALPPAQGLALPQPPFEDPGHIGKEGPLSGDRSLQAADEDALPVEVDVGNA